MTPRSTLTSFRNIFRGNCSLRLSLPICLTHRAFRQHSADTQEQAAETKKPGRPLRTAGQEMPENFEGGSASCTHVFTKA